MTLLWKFGVGVAAGGVFTLWLFIVVGLVVKALRFWGVAI